MLVLGRREKQSLILVDVATIIVCSIDGNRCQIGIEANRDIEVKRGENVKADPHHAPLVEWQYDGNGLWFGIVGKSPLWVINITPRGKFDVSGSVPSRAYSLSFHVFHSLESAQKAIEKAERAIQIAAST